MSDDARKAGLLAKHVIKLNNIGQQRLLSIAKNYGIDIGADMDLASLRAMIAMKVVEREEETTKSATVRALEESQLEADLVERSVQG